MIATFNDLRPLDSDLAYTTAIAFVLSVRKHDTTRTHDTIPRTSTNEYDGTVRHLPAWAPGAGFQKTAQRFRATVLELVNKPYAWVKGQMVSLLLEYSSGVVGVGGLVGWL